jgi:ABC-type transport system substrate-binding protein
MHTLIAPVLNGGLPDEVYQAVWNGCVVQLPLVSLGFKGWRADQCREVPTVANSEEDPLGKWTIFRIDPRAMWSDGAPITAADFLFAFRLIMDPNVEGAVWLGGSPPSFFSLMNLTTLDTHTVRIDWTIPYGDYLAALAQLTPLPLHVYARGPYSGVYDPTTDTYNSKLTQQMAAKPNFNLWIPAGNGPFTVQRVDGYDSPTAYHPNVPSTARRLVFTRNPRFFSNFFHRPALEQVTFESVWSPDLLEHPERSVAQGDALIAMYRQGGLILADGFGPPMLSHLVGIPAGEVVSSPATNVIALGFNQRGEAPNARANGGMSILRDIRMRMALTQAFDRCAALRAEFGVRNCADPIYHTDELTAPPASDYDPTFALPAYDPVAAAKLLNDAGFPLVKGVRRYRDGTTPLQLLVSLSGGGTPYLGMVRRLQQDYARNLHITVQIEQPLGNLLGDTGVTGAFDIGLVFYGEVPDPVGQIAGSEGWDGASIPSPQNPNGQNIFGLIDPWVLAENRLGTQTVNDDPRAQVYSDLARHVAQQFDFLPLLINADTTLVKPTLCNYKKWPAYGAYLWNMADWYVAPSCP